MAVFRLQDLIPHATQKVFRIGLDLLTMLQRASRMIGHSQALIWQFWQIELHQHFAHISRQLRHTRRFLRQRAAVKHMAVIFHSGPAA